MLFISSLLITSYQNQEVLGFKIFGFDLSRLANLRAPPSRPSYQPRPVYQDIPEPPPPKLDPRPNNYVEYAYRQPEYNSVYSDQYVSPPNSKQDIYSAPVIEPQSYVESQPLGKYGYGIDDTQY